MTTAVFQGWASLSSEAASDVDSVGTQGCFKPLDLIKFVFGESFPGVIELNRMKVLFVSPKDPDKPGNLKFLFGGEDTFTRTLLANPPPGVEYCHHDQALEEGKVVYTPFQKLLPWPVRIRALPPDAGVQCLEIKEDFDLIHAHAYCLKLKNYSGPVVLSDSSSNLLFLKDYLGWGERRIDLSYGLRRFLFQKVDVYDQNLNLKEAPLVVWSEFAKKIHLQLGASPDQVFVVPPGIEKAKFRKQKHSGFNILFIGHWLRRKGGDFLLNAYRDLKKKYPQIRLTLIGCLPKGEELPPDTWHRDHLPREELLRDHFSLADVLVLVPPVAEGYGLVVLEAASYGVPVIVSRVYALPELVEDGRSGFVVRPGSLKELITKLEVLIEDPALGINMGTAAKGRFLKNFWIKKTNEKLLEVYQAAARRQFQEE